MITFLLLAIAYVGLGYALVRWLYGKPFAVAGTAVPGNKSAQSISQPPAISAGDRTQPLLPEAAEEETEKAKTGPRPPTPVAPKTWAGFNQQLAPIKERARYLRMADDKQLVREVIAQFLQCATAWYDWLLECLNSGSASTVELPGGGDINVLEMYASQFESSISNLKAIDWSESAVAILDRLEREFDLLNSYQRAGARRPNNSLATV